jgi:hypothetical protein
LNKTIIIQSYETPHHYPVIVLHRNDS